MKDFREFLLRGNVVDLAVGFVIGVAFAGVVTATTTGIITPLIGAIFGTQDFSTLTFTINSSTFFYGNVISALIAFVATAAVVFYFVVKPYNILRDRRRSDEPATTRECPECLSEIPLAAKRCAFCTSAVS